jgi:hypothetical protein
MNANLYALIEAHFPREGEVPCLLTPDGPVIHYGDLAEESARLAHALVRAGCVPGDRVAVQADKHWRVLALYLACLRAGLVYLPLNTGYQKPSWSSSTTRRRASSSAVRKRWAWWRPWRIATVLTIDANGGGEDDRAAAESAEFETVQSRPDDLAAILYTGTTGRSKGGADASQPRVERAGARRGVGFTRGDVLLHALPIYHVRVVCRDPLRVAVRCAAHLAAEIRREDVIVAARRDGDDGRADVIRGCSPNRRSRATAEVTCACSCRARHRRRRDVRCIARVSGNRSSNAMA